MMPQLLFIISLSLASASYEQTMIQIRDKIEPSDFSESFIKSIPIISSSDDKQTNSIIDEGEDSCLDGKCQSIITPLSININIFETLTQLQIDLKDLEAQQGSLYSEQRIGNLQVQDLTFELSSLVSTYMHLKAQMTMLDGKDQEMRNNRGQDELNYNNRQKYNFRVVETLGLITDKLAQVVFEQQDRLQRTTSLVETVGKTLMDDIAEELGESNPILALVQLTTSFDEQTVIRVIQSLETLRSSFLKNIEQIEDQEQLEIVFILNSKYKQRNHNTVLSQISDIRNALANDSRTTQIQIKKRNNQRVLVIASLEHISSNLEAVGRGAIIIRNQIEISTVLQQSTQQQMEKQINTVQQAQHIIQLQA